jgi:ribosomal protein S18 acetylase RimI-like enzyme
MNITIRECISDDLFDLQEISYKTYNDTFGHLNTPANMQAYLEQAFAIEKLQNELSNINSNFYFLYADEELSGYLKLNEYAAQSDIRDPASLEIERIYLTKESQGKGLGNILINKAIEVANIRAKSYIWLGVWEKNDKALQFYKKNGFYVISKHSFFMGEDEQTDFIMRKDL